jgi:hypothetical protein
LYRETLSKTVAMEGKMKSKLVGQKKNKVGSHPGLPGLTFRVDRVLLGQITNCFLLKPGPFPSSGWPDRISKLWLQLHTIYLYFCQEITVTIVLAKLSQYIQSNTNWHFGFDQVGPNKNLFDMVQASSWRGWDFTRENHGSTVNKLT